MKGPDSHLRQAFPQMDKIRICITDVVRYVLDIPASPGRMIPVHSEKMLVYGTALRYKHVPAPPRAEIIPSHTVALF